MKIYLLMCLNDVIGEKFYTDERVVIREVEIANAITGEDFWYKTLYESEKGADTKLAAN